MDIVLKDPASENSPLLDDGETSVQPSKVDISANVSSDVLGVEKEFVKATGDLQASGSSVSNEKEVTLENIREIFISVLESLPLVRVIQEDSSEDSVPLLSSVPSIKISKAVDDKDEIVASACSVQKAKASTSTSDSTRMPADTGYLKFEEVDDISSNSASLGKDIAKQYGDEDKPFFYISSSELPPELQYHGSGSSSGFVTPRNPVASKSRTSPLRSNELGASRCLGSKSLHRAIFLIAIIVAFIGFSLYSLSVKGKVPDIYENLGMWTSIIAGVIGGFSFVYLSILDFLPDPRRKLDRVRDAETSVRTTENTENCDEECSTPETSRAVRRGNRKTPRILSCEVSSDNQESENRMLTYEEMKESAQKIIELFDTSSTHAIREESTSEQPDTSEMVEKSSSDDTSSEQPIKELEEKLHGKEKLENSKIIDGSKEESDKHAAPLSITDSDKAFLQWCKKNVTGKQHDQTEGMKTDASRQETYKEQSFGKTSIQHSGKEVAEKQLDGNEETVLSDASKQETYKEQSSGKTSIQQSGKEVAEKQFDGNEETDLSKEQLDKELTEMQPPEIQPTNKEKAKQRIEKIIQLFDDAISKQGSGEGSRNSQTAASEREESKSEGISIQQLINDLTEKQLDVDEKEDETKLDCTSK